MPTATRTSLWLGAALLLVAVNLRLPIAGVPPVVDAVSAGLGLSHAAAGAITTLPVLCFAVAAPLAPAIARRVGDELVLLVALVLIAAGTAVRIVPELAPFYAGTLLIGVGIAVGNVLIPSVIKRRYEHPGVMTGLYVTIMTAGAAVAAAAAVPLEGGLGWELAIAMWGVPSIVAAVAWLPVVRTARAERPPAPPPKVSLWRDGRAWLLTAMMGAQSLLFYAVVAWVPEIVADAGFSEGGAALMLSLAMVLGVPATLTVPVLAGRGGDQRGLVAFAGTLWLTGLVGLLAWPGTATALWMVLMGLGQGAGFSLVMALVVLRSPDGPHAAALSGMVQAIGYAVAASGPFLVGAIHDATGSWTPAIAFLVGVAAILLATGLAAARPGMVRSARRLP